MQKLTKWFRKEFENNKLIKTQLTEFQGYESNGDLKFQLDNHDSNKSLFVNPNCFPLHEITVNKDLIKIQWIEIK